MALICRIRKWAARPVTWGFVLLSYVGVFAALAVSGGAIQGNASVAHDLCRVVQNVHTNAVDQLATDQAALGSTKAYLADPDVNHDALYKRVVEGLPLAKARVRASQNRVAATRVPGSCLQKGQ